MSNNFQRLVFYLPFVELFFTIKAISHFVWLGVRYHDDGKNKQDEKHGHLKQNKLSIWVTQKSYKSKNPKMFSSFQNFYNLPFENNYFSWVYRRKTACNWWIQNNFVSFYTLLYPVEYKNSKISSNKLLTYFLFSLSTSSPFYESTWMFRRNE